MYVLFIQRNTLLPQRITTVVDDISENNLLIDPVKDILENWTDGKTTPVLPPAGIVGRKLKVKQKFLGS